MDTGQRRYNPSRQVPHVIALLSGHISFHGLEPTLPASEHGSNRAACTVSVRGSTPYARLSGRVKPAA